MRKKIVVFVSVSIILFFVLFNILWYVITHSLYSTYSEGMEKLETFTYCEYDQDEYGYVVSFPEYLHFNTGCLSVTDSKSYSSLLIWPKYNNKSYEYGLRLNYKDEEYEIEVTKEGRAVNPYDQSIIDSNKEMVERLYEKAEKQWGESIWR